MEFHQVLLVFVGEVYIFVYPFLPVRIVLLYDKMNKSMAHLDLGYDKLKFSKNRGSETRISSIELLDIPLFSGLEL